MKDNVNLLDLYNTNEQFKQYVDKYAKHHGKLFPEDCFYDQAVMSYAEYVRGRKKLNE